MQKLLILQGCPASGKSTYAKKLIEQDPSYVIVNRDSLRRMRGKYWIPEQEDMITDWEMNCIICGLNRGQNVIVDATNLNPKTLKRIQDLVSEPSKVEIEYKMFDTSLEECLRRDLLRGEESVGEKVIREFFGRYISRVPKEFKVDRVIQDFALPNAVICDLDGTLCLHNGRGPYEEEKCDTDLVNPAVLEVLRAVSARGSKIIFLSGRSTDVLIKSMAWIDNIDNNHSGITAWELYMRKSGDTRDDRIVKKELFDTHIKDKYYVDFVLDDRDKVVKLWRDMGLHCLQVNYGNF